MPVSVPVEQMGAQEEGFVAQNRVRRTVGDDAAGVEHHAAVGDVADDGQVVRGGDDRLRAGVLREEIDGLTLALRIERGGRFVEEQHVGVEDEDARQRDAFFLAAGEPVRRAVPEVFDAHVLQGEMPTRSTISARGQRSCSGPKATSSNTVGLKSCTSGFWKMSATRRRKAKANFSWANASSVSSAPSKRAVPAAAKYSPASTRSRVDLPEPLAPRTATRSPRGDVERHPVERGGLPGSGR